MLRNKIWLALPLLMVTAMSLRTGGMLDPAGAPALWSGSNAVAWAQDAGSGEPGAPPAEPEPAPAPSKPKPKPQAEVVAPTASGYLAPDLLKQLTAALTTNPKQPAAVTAPENVTVLSVPDAYAVYFATVDEIRSAESQAGDSVAVEDVVFNDAHFIGYAPVTFAVPAGDHVLAVRAMSRQEGFDGDCVRKATRDVITGGRRYSYHLYPLRKRAGEYQCFVTNFLTPEVKTGDLGEVLLARGTFAVPVADLVARLASNTGVPAEQRESVAVSLNQLGVAFYRGGGTTYLVKLGLVGDTVSLNEWVREETAAE